MKQMKQSEVMQMAATMCAGIFANPTSGELMHNRYGRCSVINEMIQDVMSALQVAGITIVDDNGGTI